MLVNLYKSKTPLAVFSFPVFIGLLALPVFFQTNTLTASFFSWQTNFVDAVTGSNVTNYLASILLVYLAGVEINRQVNVYGFYSKNTYLPGVVYSLYIYAFGQLQFSMLLLAYCFLTYGLGFLLRINRQDSAISNVFMAGLLFGGATVFEPLFFPALLLPWVALIVFRPFNWREWFVLLVSAVIPWVYTYGVHFFVDGTIELETEPIAIVNSELDFSLDRIALMVFMSLITVFSIWRYLVIARNQLLVFKKRSRLLAYFIGLMVASYFLGWLMLDLMLIAAVVPLSILLGVQLLHNRSMLYTNIILFLWIALVIGDILL